ncbi:hypothetical protein TWF730_006690 [Orbilia blumenaviensis]|uniref:DNA excision repair protein ERCC-6 n=1 Tax=Orbilia blumenaviensis TaxID=1796055 RepID=A0AAV9VL97_9PEZI
MDEALNFEEELGLQAFTHESLEERVAEKAEAEMLEKEAKESQKMKEREAAILKKLDGEIRVTRGLVESTFGPKKATYKEKLDELLAKVELHSANIVDIERRLQQRAVKAKASASSSRDQRAGESRRDYLIRKGVLNPFSKDGSGGDEPAQVADTQTATETAAEATTVTAAALSFQDLRAPGFAQEQAKVTKRARVTVTASTATAVDGRPSPRRQKVQLVTGKVSGFENDYEEDSEDVRAPRPQRAAKRAAVRVEERFSDSSYEESDEKEEGEWEEEGADEEESADEDEDEEAEEVMPTSKKGKGRALRSRSRGRDEEDLDEEEDLRGYDDGYEHVYQERLKSWCAKRAAARVAKDEEGDDEEVPEWFKPSPSAPDHIVDEGFKLPGDIAHSLFDYQKTAVNWLWNLHAKQHTGGILGDEMGLGKTIQTIAFIGGLHYSRLLTKPVLVVAPATVLKQWCNEFHKWWPCLRVSILHSSGSGMLSVAADKEVEEIIGDDEDLLDALENTAPSKAQKAAKKIVDKVKAKGHILISTYTGLSTYQKLLLETDWECVVLDEGHKIRNPDAKITIAAKQLRSSTRFILSGTPIQNNLRELWSLFDFVYPGKLGIYQVFNEHIAIPIKLGGYAGANNTQIHTAFKCAVVLREMISPYILRRLKADVAVLPPKQDQVLFCNLVVQQQEAYETYIKSPEASAIFSGKRDVLAGIDVLRKICNHPDLCNRDKLSVDPEFDYGNPVRSGKMQIVKGLLKAWEKDNLKCLIFSQGTQMLDILERFVKKSKYSYLRLDGSTDIKSRQSMVDQFNNDPALQVFLLTTKVGGYGLNLTGATRIIIFDPDWNPSNDMQARERSWRLGQKHEVRIYRLLSRGTIEEKIYQRQLYKQFLTKKILEDPEQRRVFRMDDMQDLFTLGSVEHGTETGSLFEGVERTLMAKKQISEDEQSEEVQKIAGVHKLENFIGGASNMLSGSMTGEPSKEGAKATESLSKAGKKRKRNEADKNDHLLESILAKAGVHSIVEHDAIMTTSKSSSDIIEREANRFADSARAALERSFETVKKYNVPGKPAWTGRVAPKPKNKIRYKVLPNRDLKENEIPLYIVDWFMDQKKRKKKATSAAILEAFDPIIKRKFQTLFKRTLKELAERDRESGTWQLKPGVP